MLQSLILKRSFPRFLLSIDKVDRIFSSYIDGTINHLRLLKRLATIAAHALSAIPIVFPEEAEPSHSVICFLAIPLPRPESISPIPVRRVFWLPPFDNHLS